MGKFITLLFLIVLSLGVKSQVPSVKGQDDTSKMYPVNYEVPGKSAIKLNSTTVLLDTDKDNLLLNGSFEAQTATQGWTVTSLATATASTSDVFEGKKKVCMSGVGSIFQMLSDTDKYHGRKFIARFNIQNPQGREGRACIYDGEDLHKCVQIQKSDDFVEYVTGDTFIKGKSYGVIVNSLELDDICVDAVSVKLDPNEAYVAEIEGRYQYMQLTKEGWTPSSYFTNGSVVKDDKNSSLISYNSTTGDFTALADADVSVNSYLRASSNGRAQIAIELGDLTVAITTGDATGSTYRVNASSSFRMNRGQVFKVHNTGIVSATEAFVSILAKARSQVVVYPDETFSTDINPVYWKATPCGEDEIGCYNTYEYAANTNTRTICSTRPTQSDTDMRVNGIKIFTRVYANASSCAEPAMLVFRLPKKLANPSLTLYKDTSKTATAVLDHGIQDQYQWGLYGKWYDSKSGSLTIDSGYAVAEATNLINRFGFSDLSAQTNGYLVINASKTGAVLANKPPRELVKVVPHFGGLGETEIYSDGFIKGTQFFTSQGGTGSGTNYAYIVPFRDTNIAISRCLNSSSVDNARKTDVAVYNISTTGFNFDRPANVIANCFLFRGYGAASYLLDNYGIKVNY